MVENRKEEMEKDRISTIEEIEEIEVEEEVAREEAKKSGINEDL